ncbi:ATP synthase F1 subunit delta [Lacinutrix sp. MedPE-SW]|uniref:ATP synthase F1 subunit delta n=1 Tax=Lacinutrix sp. MedPE-SW TaxID=1860087 RepID=UPI000915BAFB|nr:ATP synthase F1 subunit delta [Lacinutrix sp. MedPE-SW]OIQ23540.1 MAG: ATP synthase F1 subunit delta [Lacinutrix sp. MedPE-SW]
MARAAIRYAKAVLSIANDQNTAEAVNKDMTLIANTIAENKDLSNMLLSPVITPSIKKSALLEIFKGINTVTSNLIDTLITNKRIDIISNVASKYTELYDASKGIQVATVTTAVALTDDLKAKVLNKAKELTGKDVTVNSIIDESILGGFILRVGDIQYNASISNKLDKLKREFTIN